MEGLIKGIIDVALGHNDNNNNNDDDDDHVDREFREERSRSTWAEVVSGNDHDGDTSGASHDNYNRRRPTPNSGRRQEEEAKGSANDQWETVRDGRNSRRPHHKDEKEGSQNDEWETLGGGRHSRQSHKDDEGASRNDKWETGGGRHSRQPHKVPVDNWHGYKRPLQEQVYSDDVEYSAHLEPSEEELSILSQACNKLWELDSNRLVPGKDYQIDCGEGKKVYQDGDMAQGSLLYWVNEDIFRRPTISRFCSLLDNYNPNEGCKEVVTSDERQEQAAFIEEISRTAPIKYLHKYLTSKGVVSENYQDFKKMMTDIWFSLYGRGGTSSSSSAFEHVFVGEIKQRGEHEVSGFHNWLQFYLEEAKGRVDYQGYIFPRRRGQVPDSETQLLTLQFSWNGILKSVSSTLVGVSPEFEIALYTMCFFMGEEDNHVQLGPYSVNIKCYRLGRDKIGSVFPVAEY